MDKYAVVGNPVAHSLSPRIHGLFAEQTGQAMVYQRLLAPLDGFAPTVEAFFASGGKGLNVTVPFKPEAASWVTTLDPEAAAAGAVNTIVCWTPGGALPPSTSSIAAQPSVLPGGISTRGFNTDGLGLVRDLRDNHGQRLEGSRILLLGAGGAVHGVVRPLLREKPRTLVIANRTAEKALTLAATLRAEGFVEELGSRVSGTGLDGLGDDFDVIISGSSAGLDPGAETGARRGSGGQLPPSIFRGAFCYDMIYGASTPFCRLAAERGASRVEDGIGMLVEQAALAFEIWRGIAPATEPVLAQLRRERLSA